MSAIAFLFQNLFVAMTPSYDSILRRERYFNILSSPTITVSRAALCINIVSSKITIRGVQRMLDSDIASLFQVGAKRMNQQMKRNPDCFSEDFCFRHTKEEILRSQFATSSSWGGRRCLPYVYAEQRIIALARVLCSGLADKMAAEETAPSLVLSRAMPLGRFVSKYGDFESKKAFGLEDYKMFLLNRYLNKVYNLPKDSLIRYVLPTRLRPKTSTNSARLL